MQELPFQQSQFLFVSPGKFKHELSVRITPFLSLEWELYIDGVSVAYCLDAQINILLTADLNRALSWDNINAMYGKLLTDAKTQP